MRGIVKFYDNEKEFGFIASVEMDEDLYFSNKNISSDRRLYKKQKVEFRPIKTDRGMVADDIYVLRYE
jgi:cold shock CspA family protein